MKLSQAPKTNSSSGSGAIPSRHLPQFRRTLLSWFNHNQRDLPWRRTDDPYRIWISEIMLQQTRVAAVIPYYERFVAKFPTVRELSRARISSVLSSWSGLGYYSRARNLHRAARIIVAKHDGEFPRDPQSALALPGIGNYTSAAILSIAYDQPLAVLDGNVARVIARLGAIRGNLHQPKVRRKLESAAAALLASSAPGDWNQAMMELGATVCTPLSPACQECPVKRCCRARQLGIAERLPTPRRKPQTVEIKIAAAVFLDPLGRTILTRHQNGDGALFSGLWQFPAATTKSVSQRTMQTHLLSTIQQTASVPASSPPEFIASLPVARHTVTFRKIQLHPFLIRVRELPVIPGARAIRLNSVEGGTVPISNATRKIAHAALNNR